MRSQGVQPTITVDARREAQGKGAARRASEDGALERELETLMMEKLVEENRRLQEQLARVQQENLTLERRRERERTPPPRPPPLPCPVTPRLGTGGSYHSEPRYTPQGTQVPFSGGGPDAEFAEVPEFPQWTCIGGSAVPDTEMQPGRPGQDHKGHPGGRGVGPSIAESKTMWLEQEVRSLQATLERMTGEKKTSTYWDQPVHRSADPDPPGASVMLETKEEALRSVPITIPVLVPPEARNAALEAGDWLAQLRPLVGDVAASATKWWDDLMSVTNQAYHTWLSLGFLERLHVQAPFMEETSLRQTRLDQRVTMMLMNSLPSELKNELIATRQLHTAGGIFKVLRTYQPGGLGEKAATLAALTETRC